MKKMLLQLWVGCSLGLAGLSSHAEALEDLLQARWFDVELIVFERLDVLDATSGEQLTLRGPRQWPAALTELWGPALDAAAALQSTFPADQPQPQCLGYPELRERDPLHPLLAPANEFSDATSRFSDRRIDAADTADTAPSTEDPAGADTATGELPQNTPTLTMTPYLQLLADVAAWEAELFAQALQPQRDLALLPQVKALNRQRHLRPVIHQRWRQPVPPRDAPLAVYLSAQVDESAPLTANGYAKIEGYVSVTVSRYLHVAPTLWYHADTLGMEPVALPAPVRPFAPDGEAYMQLTTSRRMRSGDLHYIDHPKIGVLVRIDPVPLPEALVARWEMLEADDRP